MKRSILILLVLITGVAGAQTLSSKTNELHLNLKQSTATAFPQIQWIQPKIDYSSVFEDKVAVEANIVSEVALSNVSMTIVDTKTNEVFGSRTYSDVTGKTYTVRQTLTLATDGRFSIEIKAINVTGGIVSSKRHVILGKEAEGYISADRKDYALIFATDVYDHWDDLVNPINDARTLATELTEKYGFQTEVVENSDFEEVFEKIREYNERAFNPQDQLLIFFAGHGMFDETFGEGYVVAKNSLAKDNSRTSYISHARLRSIIDNIPCKHVLLMMDVCFGGTLDPLIARNRSLDELTEREMLARKFSYRTRKYLTSGGKEYVSDGIPGKHSPFAAKLIESLRSFGGEDGILTLAELQVYMEKLKQAPRFGSFGEDEKLSDFVFVRKEH